MFPTVARAVALITCAVLLAPAPAVGAPEGSTFLADLPTGFADPLDGSGNAASTDGTAVSGDGSRVVFSSGADGLSDRDDDRVVNVFLRDRAAGTTSLVSVGVDGAPADGASYDAQIDDDGRRVVFVSEARNLVAGAPLRGVYVHDLQAGTTTLVSRATGEGAPADAADEPALSGSGLYVAFTTFDALDSADTNGFPDVYARYLPTGDTELVSRASGTGAAGNGYARQPSVEGFAVAFASSATNLVAGVTDANGGDDVFKRTLARAPAGPNVTTLVSARDGAPAATGDGVSESPAISTGGSLVAFQTSATNLDAQTVDGNERTDVVLRRLSTADTEIVSRADGPSGALGDRSSTRPVLATVGARIHVGFLSTATTLVPGVDGGAVRPFLRTLDGATATTELLGRGQGTGGPPADAHASGLSLDAGARHAAFLTAAGNLGVPLGDHPDVVVRYRATGVVDVASLPSSGGPLPEGLGHAVPSTGPGVSADGRYVLFSSAADRLHPDRLFGHVFRRDLATGTTVLVDRATGAEGAVTTQGATAGSISADGTRVAFTTRDALDPVADGNTVADVYVRDLAAGTTTLVSRRTGAGGVAGDGASDDGRISGDGTRVAFSTRAPALAAGADVAAQVLVRDLQTHETTLVSRADGPAGARGDAASRAPAIDADGSRVAFVSSSTNLTADKTTTYSAAFVRDLAAGTTRVIRPDDADPGISTYAVALSADGTRVAVDATASAGTSTEGDLDVYVRDLASGAVRRASRADGPEGAETDGPAELVALSADGDAALFRSAAPNLGMAPGDEPRLWLRHLAEGRTTLISRASGTEGAPLRTRVALGWPDADGSCVAFGGRDRALVAPGQTGDFQRVAMRAVRGDCPAPLPAQEPGSSGPSTGGAGGPVAAEVLANPAPVLSGLSLSRPRFRVGPRPTAVRASRASSGTTIRFRLSEPARVTLAIERSVTGRRVGRTCRPASAALRRRARCTRYASRGTLHRRAGAGRTQVAFSGRVGRRALPAGRYRLVARAVDAEGARSPARTVTFTVQAG